MRTETILMILVGVLVVLPGCTRSEETTKPETHSLTRLDEHHTLGAPVVVENLTVWPVFTDEPLDVGEFLTLKEAVDEEVAEVREAGVGQNDAIGLGRVVRGEDGRERTEDVSIELPQQGRGGATVGTLVIENRGDVPILVCAGTIVQGGNQDRQIAQDFVIEAKATVPVDAFCVEQGRWSSTRLGSATNLQFLVNTAQATPSVRAAGQFSNSQDFVWSEVAKVKAKTAFKLKYAVDSDVEALDLENLRAHEDSTSLAVMLDASKEGAGKDLDAIVGKVDAHFAALGAEPVGFAYAVNGKPVNVRTFAHHRVFAKQFPAFVRTMATEAYLVRGEKDAPVARAEDVVAMVREINEARESVSPTSAGNVNGVRRADVGYGANCYFWSRPDEKGKERVALTRDWTSK
ncbi:MAG: ARPP-1 family domain-containing protein [Planctomycetota bacterium]